MISARFLWDQPAAAPAPRRKRLQIRLMLQGSRPWCWASAVAMIASWARRFDLAICEIVDAWILREGSASSCCIDERGCLTRAPLVGMAAILNETFGISSTISKRPLSFAEIAGQLDADLPVVAYLRTEWNAHVVVITGYQEPNLLTVLDSALGEYTVTDETLAHSREYGTWTETLMVTGVRPSIACARRVEYGYEVAPCAPPYDALACIAMVARQRVRCAPIQFDYRRPNVFGRRQ